MPALRVCMMSTFSRSTWLKAKRTILARSPLTRDSSVTASRRSMGRRSVMPGRLSVHRCPSRFTFRTAFFAAFFTATGYPSETLPYPVPCPVTGATLRRHRRVGTVKQQILLNPYKEPVPRPHHNRWLDVQIPARYFNSQLADLLADRLPNLLPDCRRLQHRRVCSLTQLDTGREQGREQCAGEDSAPVIVHLVTKPRRAGTVVPFKAAERKTTSVREYNTPPDCLQRILTVAYVRIINPHKCTPGRY